MTRKPRTIVIVGGGFSGIMLATNLLRRKTSGAWRIVLVERSAQIGGPAYVARDYPYLLNVPAGRMSADSRAPDAFLRFAQRRAPATSADDFVPRSWYGDYLRELLAEAESAAPARVGLERMRADVTGITRIASHPGLRVALRDGRALHADEVVLACGNPSPTRLPGLSGIQDHPGYVGDACRDSGRTDMRGEVLLVGTGLTMADAALAATARGATRVLAISRRGLLPPRQTTGTHGAGDDQTVVRLAAARPVRELLHVARLLAREFDARGADWRGIVNAIREQAPEIWHSLDAKQRGQFLRHVRPYWDVHRHRLPPNTAERFDVLRRSGQLHVHAGRILHACPDDSRLQVTWLPRGAREPRQLTVDWVVNCTGPDYDLRRSRDPLFRSAIRDGLVVPDAFGLGLHTSAHGALVDAQGDVSRDLFCLGPMLRADHWETTAVAELRVHAEALAAHLAGASAPSAVSVRHLDSQASRLQAGHMSPGMVHAVNRHFERESRTATLPT